MSPRAAGARLGVAAAALALAFTALVVSRPAAAGTKDAIRALERALAQKNVVAGRAAIRNLGKDPTVRGAKALLQTAVQARDLDLFEALSAALRAHESSEKALRYLVQQAHRNRDWSLRFLLVDALSGVRSEPATAALFKAYRDKHPLVAAHAIEASAANKRYDAIPKIIERFVQVDEKPRGLEAVQAAAKKGLEALTGESFPTGFDWDGWWKVQGDRFDPKTVAKRRADRKRGGSTVLRRIADRGDQQFLERLEKGDIYCVSGEFDKVQAVLTHLKLPHTVWARSDLAKKVREIPPTAVLVFNCSSGNKPLANDTVRALSSFVARGGYLFTSDWELKNVLVRVVPGYIDVGQTTTEHEFPIRPNPRAAAHPYLRDVFPKNPYKLAGFRWKIDGASFAIRVGRPKAVTELVICDALEKQYHSRVVACTFRHKRGAVLHVLSHFEKQQDAKGDGFALQQLFLNFVIEKQRFRKRKR